MSYLAESLSQTDQYNRELFPHGNNSISCFVHMPPFIRKAKTTKVKRGELIKSNKSVL